MLEVVERGGIAGHVRLDVIFLDVKAFATVGASHPVEVGGRTQLQGEEDLDRGVTGPAADVAEVLAVVIEPGEEGILGDLLGDLRGDRPDPGYLTYLALSESFQPRLTTS